MKTAIAITPGAEHGVGPELMLKALTIFKSPRSLQYFWCGDEQSLQLAAKRSGIFFEMTSPSQAVVDHTIDVVVMEPCPEGIDRTLWFLQNAVMLFEQKKIHGIVTGPIDKAPLNLAHDQKFAGQTEYFCHYLGAKKALMTFMGGPFILSMLTGHLPLKDVALAITPTLIFEHIKSITHYVGTILGKDPRAIKTTILGLNPHAGENGLLGEEEEITIKPVINALRKEGFLVQGPTPADGFFAYFHKLLPLDTPDVVIAMYHDQGLIPYKLMASGGGVNVSLGLPIVRTSPSHGIAAELAGLHKACHLSALNAIKMAAELARLIPTDL